MVGLVEFKLFIAELKKLLESEYLERDKADLSRGLDTGLLANPLIPIGAQKPMGVGAGRWLGQAAARPGPSGDRDFDLAPQAWPCWRLGGLAPGCYLLMRC